MQGVMYKDPIRGRVQESLAGICKEREEGLIFVFVRNILKFA